MHGQCRQWLVLVAVIQGICRVQHLNNDAELQECPFPSPPSCCTPLGWPACTWLCAGVGAQGFQAYQQQQGRMCQGKQALVCLSPELRYRTSRLQKRQATSQHPVHTEQLPAACVLWRHSWSCLIPQAPQQGTAWLTLTFFLAFSLATIALRTLLGTVQNQYYCRVQTDKPSILVCLVMPHHVLFIGVERRATALQPAVAGHVYVLSCALRC